MRPLLFITIFFLPFMSCGKESSESFISIQWNMNRVEGVTSGTLNQTISLTVYYPTSSGCDVFDKFEQSSQGNIISIKALGHTVKSNFCTYAAIEKTATFNFKPISTGSFELRFINKDNSYFTHTLTIK